MILLQAKQAALARGGRVVLSGLDFALESGQLVCAVGENGAGKTTLLQALLGQLAPAAGSIALAPGLRPGSIGYVPQHSTAQAALPATVAEVVCSGRLGAAGWRPFYTQADRAAARQQLQALGLAPLAQQRFSALSGGQQRRVLLARALAAAGQLLLLDEPLAGLDAASRAQFWAALAAYARSGGAVLMATHDLAGANAHAHRLLTLGDGRQLSFAAPKGGVAP